MVGWFGLHFVCVIVTNAWRTWKRKTDPDWGDRPSATRTALWIGPIAEADCEMRAPMRALLLALLCAAGLSSCG